MFSKCLCDIIRFELFFLSNVSILFFFNKIIKIFIFGYCKLFFIVDFKCGDRSIDQLIFFVKINFLIINSENLFLFIIEYLSL